MNATNTLHTAAGWIVTIVAPFAIILTGVRILLTPVWVNIEYRMPGFPEDPYGFTLQDRLKWSLVSLDYLVNDAGIEYLANTRFVEDDVPIYNDRELGHMVDVKNVVKGALAVWWSSLGLLLVFGLWARYGGWGAAYRTGLVRGGWLTIGFVGIVILFVIIAFNGFFVYFHEVFFDPGTWTFSYTDTLIRLFPERFWQDAFLWIGGLSILISLWLISLSRSART